MPFYAQTHLCKTSLPVQAKQSKTQNAIYLPGGDAKISLVDARDVAAVAAGVLTGNGSQHMNKVYDITGPEALSHSQFADILSKETGRKISYMNISGEDST